MAQTTWTSITNRCVTVLQGITDIGNVYNRLRLLYNEDTLTSIGLATVGAEKKLRTWFVTLGAMDSQYADASGEQQWTRSVKIEGFLQLEDAASSELTALSLAEAVIRTIGGDAWSTRLGGNILFAKAPKLVNNEPRLFGPVLCHYIRIEMPISTLEL
jgi:hypothetical protein